MRCLFSPSSSSPFFYIDTGQKGLRCDAMRCDAAQVEAFAHLQPKGGIKKCKEFLKTAPVDPKILESASR